MSACKFCVPLSHLTNYAPLADARTSSNAGNGQLTPCERWIEIAPHCIVTLSPVQVSEGHALAILLAHRADLSDPKVHPGELEGLMDTVRRTSQRLKERLGCERVYAASLCDGIEHLHFHLVPRYKNDQTGFEYLGEAERRHNSGEWIGPRDIPGRVRYLEALARRLR